MSKGKAFETPKGSVTIHVDVSWPRSMDGQNIKDYEHTKMIADQNICTQSDFAVVIRTENNDKTEWGVSVNGPNPEIEDYFVCASEASAYKLAALINL